MSQVPLARRRFVRQGGEGRSVEGEAAEGEEAEEEEAEMKKRPAAREVP